MSEKNHITVRAFEKACESTAIYPRDKFPWDNEDTKSSAIILEGGFVPKKIKPAFVSDYPVFGLVSEAGEVVGVYKKVMRDKDAKLDSESIAKIRAEIGDVLWYIAMISNEFFGTNGFRYTYARYLHIMAEQHIGQGIDIGEDASKKIHSLIGNRVEEPPVPDEDDEKIECAYHLMGVKAKEGIDSRFLHHNFLLDSLGMAKAAEEEGKTLEDALRTFAEALIRPILYSLCIMASEVMVGRNRIEMNYEAQNERGVAEGENAFHHTLSSLLCIIQQIEVCLQTIEGKLRPEGFCELFDGVVAKLKSRADRNKLQGSGDDR